MLQHSKWHKNGKGEQRSFPSRQVSVIVWVSSVLWMLIDNTAGSFNTRSSYGALEDPTERARHTYQVQQSSVHDVSSLTCFGQHIHTPWLLP